MADAEPSEGEGHKTPHSAQPITVRLWFQGQEQLYTLGDGTSCSFEDGKMLTVLEGSLYLYCSDAPPVPRPNHIFIKINDKLRYTPICADFGPLNLGTP